jgi:hypothetical protein
MAIALDGKNASAYVNRGNSRYFLHDIRGACDDWKIAYGLGHSRVLTSIRAVCR